MMSLYLLVPQASNDEAVTHSASAAIIPMPTYNIQCTFLLPRFAAVDGAGAGWIVVLRPERACIGPGNGLYACAVRRGGTGICWRVVSGVISRVPRRPLVGLFQRIALVCGRGGFDARGSSSASRSSSVNGSSRLP